MKTYCFTIIVVFALSLSAARAAEQSRHYVIAIAEGLPKEKGTDILRVSLDLLLKTATPGDRVEFMNAYRGVRLADFLVPPGSARDRANSREFAGKLASVKALLTNPTQGDQRLAGQLRVPQLLDMLSRMRREGEALTVILIGTPVFVTASPAEAAFNFDRGLVPTDGMIVASSSQSLFGTAERKQQARGIALYWITPDDRWGMSEMHRQALLRFWSLFCQQQGAMLVDLSADMSTAFARAVQGDTRPLLNVAPDPNDRGLTMREPPTFQRETVAGPASHSVEIPAGAPPSRIPAQTGGSAIGQAEPTPLVVPQSIARQIPQVGKGHIGIAALWLLENASEDTDVDLWVSSDSGRVPEVFWKRAVSGDAKYFRDIRNASATGDGDWRGGWEFVQISHNDLSRVSLWLNLFKASASRPITGIIRVQWNGRTIDHPFSFGQIMRGNSGADADYPARARSSYWQRIDLVALFPDVSR